METDPDKPGMCRTKKDRGRNAKDRFADDEHYSESRWTQYRGGDLDVLKLCDLALQSLSESVRSEARQAALEEAARVCDEQAREQKELRNQYAEQGIDGIRDAFDTAYLECQSLAARIRSLKGKGASQGVEEPIDMLAELKSRLAHDEQKG